MNDGDVKRDRLKDGKRQSLPALLMWSVNQETCCFKSLGKRIRLIHTARVNS